MAQLKKSVIKKIQNILNSSCFTLADFDIALPKSGTDLIVIKFRHNPDYEFSIIEKKERSKTKYSNSFALSAFGSREEINEYIVIYTKEIPGEFKRLELVEIDSFQDAYERLPKWCQNINEDLSILFEDSDDLDELRDFINEKIDDAGYSPEERFSPSETDNLNERLNNLYQKFEELKSKNEVTQTELDKIKIEFDTFKKNAQTFPKSIWAHVTNNKLIELIGNIAKSKEGRAFIIDGIKKLLIG